MVADVWKEDDVMAKLLQMVLGMLCFWTLMQLLERTCRTRNALSDDDVLNALQLWGFDEPTSHQRVLPEGRSWIQSDTLGASENVVTASWWSACHVAATNTLFVCFAPPLAKNPPDGSLRFTTISPNKTYAGQMHRHVGNVGPSIVLAIGTFKGSRLRYWAGDSQKGMRSATVKTMTDGQVSFFEHLGRRCFGRKLCSRSGAVQGS
eukprot:TRINITY_DN15385_c0_g1_i1.p2 TRINITY_DN15385_c0_g1~~TRINITY_DN15385_c0_g1_i1.p2  ORF type:complete len:206 (-),score=26.88 TRINITY_DN15385_c0_g1_i1:54-671(-)